jgi:manganese/zinc/iron transport system substrate-binding protein
MFASPLLRSLAFILSLSLLAGCGNGTNGAKARPDKIVTTTGMVADLARRVGGGLVEVEELMGPGVDPHLYQPKASDHRKLDEAALVLYNGLHLEGNMVEKLEHLKNARAISKDMPKDRLLIDSDQPDPHVWFDVSLWTHALDTTEKAMVEAFPTHAETFRKNAAAYRQELAELHEEVQRDLAKIPKSQRVLVTAHDAFRYFGRAYDVDVIGLQGVSTADDAGLKEVGRIVDRVVKDKIKTIFSESSVSDDGVQKVVERCKAQGHDVKLADGKLFSDAMDRPGTPGGTYPGMVRHNVKLMIDGLK